MEAEGGIRKRAPAKVNLGLHVLARRGDGFHEIDTLMVKLDLADTLRLRATAGGVTGELEMPEGAGFAAPLAMDGSNLAVRAAERYLDAAGIDGGIHISLSKRIPVAAGLGGGSSDAAAALLAAAELYPAEVDLEALALELGSDVPFFLHAGAAARARGRGERLTPVHVPRLSLVLANPGIAIATADAYASLQNFTRRLDPDAIAARLARGEDPGVRNALQPGVMLAHPEVREVLVALRAQELSAVSMSGSGSTCYGIGSTPEHAAEAASSIARARPGWWVAATRTTGD